jgi:hypothetical protein
MPCDSVRVTTTKLEAANVSILERAARDAFPQSAIDASVAGRLTIQLADGARVDWQKGALQVRTNAYTRDAVSIARDLTMAYGRAVVRDTAKRIGWKVEADRTDPNILTMVRE